jgi:malonyl-CoA/methylmalonyl-CoA synthetase
VDKLPVISRAAEYGSRVALRTPTEQHTYQELLARSAAAASSLLAGADDLREARVAVFAPPGAGFVAAQWGAWWAGGVVVPLSLIATEPEWEHALTDSGSAVVLAAAALTDKIGLLCRRLGVGVISTDEGGDARPVSLPLVDASRRATILYTSGTTGKPKGVVTTHAGIRRQIESLVQAWEWRASDHIPLFLPLHHVHGLINVLGCALWSGATVEPFPRFDAATVLNRVRSGAYSLFMAVPTIYVKLIEALRSVDEPDRAAAVAGFRQMRLMVSGSAALPATVHEEWFRLTGQPLLERYGMTEIGMAISNPYRGERVPGTVGQPLPGVEVRLVTESGEVLTREGEPGEIQVRGPAVFREYWNRPEATAESFDRGWFRTGDVALVENGYYRILGRKSIDIIKSGGHKLSALEVEAALLDHPAVRECAVVGVEDTTWGEAVAAAVVLRSGAVLELDPLREWCRDRLSAYKIPRRLLVVGELPRNSMGKVTKPAVRELFLS